MVGTKALLIFTSSLVVMGLGPLFFFDALYPHGADQEILAAETVPIQEDRHLFSIWNGACVPVERLVRKTMREPRSYKHVKTRHQDDAGFVHVTMLFHGKNARGVMALHRISADVDLSGKLSHIVGPEEDSPR